MKFYNEKKNLVNLSNSILKHFLIPTFNPSLESIDKILNRYPIDKKISVILLDGFGSYIQNIYKESIPFLYSHKKYKITSVFPPTTVASTTSFLTGKYPNETGYLGWIEKLPFYDTPVVTFFSSFVDSKKISPLTVKDFLPNKDIIEIINEKYNRKIACKVMSFELEDESFETFLKHSQKAIDNNIFSYLYFTNPDDYLHKYGTHSQKVNELVKNIDDKIKKFIKNNKDTLFLVIADHGHIDTEYEELMDHKDLYDLLKIKYNCLEPRSCMLFIKDDKKVEAKKLIDKYYPSKYFKVYTKKQIIKKEIFGKGKSILQFEDLLGDFLIVSISNKAIVDKYNEKLKSMHAGGTKQEKYINLAVFNQG